MSRIFIGIPSSRRYEPFWESMDDFIPHLKQYHEVKICIIKDKTISEARNEIANLYLKSDSDYLLFLDDDHSGHTLEIFNAILDPILNNNSYMCGVKCYTKDFPYHPNILIYSGVDEKKLGIPEGSGKYIPVFLDAGYMYVDLVGFGMTILTRMAFKILKEPYFSSEYVNGRLVREDNYFCDKLIRMGIRPVGYFGHTLDHQGFGEHNVPMLRQQGFNELREKYPDTKVMVS